jgi:hypothetical protein
LDFLILLIKYKLDDLTIGAKDKGGFEDVYRLGEAKEIF